MKGFIDIHTHILPGVDDGAGDLSGAVALLRQACQQGTGAVVLTPHYRGRYRGNEKQKLEPVFARLQQAVKGECPDLELYLGCEIGYEMDVSEKLAQGKLPTMNGTQYVLLEFREGSFRSRILDGVLEVLNFGYIPIVAHVERYDAFRNNPRLADEVMDLGALLQVNADSVMGKCGFGIKHYCHKLLKSHMVHFVATDAHDEKMRKPDLRACYQKVRRKYGRDYAELLFIRNPQRMLAGEEGIET